MDIDTIRYKKGDSVKCIQNVIMLSNNIPHNLSLTVDSIYLVLDVNDKISMIRVLNDINYDMWYSWIYFCNLIEHRNEVINNIIN